MVHEWLKLKHGSGIYKSLDTFFMSIQKCQVMAKLSIHQGPGPHRLYLAAVSISDCSSSSVSLVEDSSLSGSKSSKFCPAGHRFVNPLTRELVTDLGMCVTKLGLVAVQGG